MTLTNNFIIVTTCVTYCDFKICLFVYLPAYMAATVFVTLAEDPLLVQARDQLSDDLKYLLPKTLNTKLA